MAITRLSHTTIVVRDQEEAHVWYTSKLGFVTVTDDTGTIPGQRWLTVSPKGQQDFEIILYQATNDMERSWVGQGALWVLETDDCRQTCKELEEKGVNVLSQPEQRPWGISATFEDLYGNPYNLLERA